MAPLYLKYINLASKAQFLFTRRFQRAAPSQQKPTTQLIEALKNTPNISGEALTQQLLLYSRLTAQQQSEQAQGVLIVAPFLLNGVSAVVDTKSTGPD
jgi:hypothetical protein